MITSKSELNLITSSKNLNWSEEFEENSISKSNHKIIFENECYLNIFNCQLTILEN